MLTDEDASHVARLVPLRLAGHVIGDELSVDAKTLEANVLDLAFLVVAYQHGELLTLTIVGDVLEEDILDAAAGGGTILLVVEDAQVEELPATEILDADILKAHAPHQVVVAHIDGDTTLIIQLHLAVVEDVNILIHQVFHHLVGLRVTMQANHDGVGHVGPKHSPPHGDVTATATETLACGIDRGAIIGVAAEYIFIPYVVAGKGIEFELNSILVEKWKGKAYRLVIQRQKRMDGELDLWEGEYTYRCILTNDHKSSEIEIVEFYNLRGGKERIFDDMNNGFGWNRLPKSFMGENTVFLLLTALIRNFDKFIMERLDAKKFGLKATSRIKAFVFKFISVPAKWIKTSRQYVLNIYSCNNAYANVFQNDFG